MTTTAPSPQRHGYRGGGITTRRPHSPISSSSMKTLDVLATNSESMSTPAVQPFERTVAGRNVPTPSPGEVGLRSASTAHRVDGVEVQPMLDQRADGVTVRVTDSLTISCCPASHHRLRSSARHTRSGGDRVPDELTSPGETASPTCTDRTICR